MVHTSHRLEIFTRLLIGILQLHSLFCLHTQDADAPSEASLLYMERLTTEDVDVILRKTGDHRLNSRDDHQLLLYEVDRLLKQNPVVNSKL